MAKAKTFDQLTKAMNELRGQITGAKASGENAKEMEAELADLNEQRKASKQAQQRSEAKDDE